MVGAKGFEPPTLWSQTRCATRLRSTPNDVLNTADIDIFKARTSPKKSNFY